MLGLHRNRKKKAYILEGFRTAVVLNSPACAPSFWLTNDIIDPPCDGNISQESCRSGEMDKLIF